ncbi:MAG TPA: hypothetical protein DCL38_07000 [Lachnospiraceae bacterium]|nr:hypothetical protein [Lachnospiraceae bacterium]
MINGIILYNKRDYEKNIRFAQMLAEHGRASGLELSVAFTEELIYNGELLSSLGDPRFVINRSRNASAARFFEGHNIPVFNSARVSELCNDKELTKQHLSRFYKGSPIPYTEYCTLLLTDMQPYSHSTDITAALSFPVVAKPSDGHGGSFVRLLKDEQELKEYLSAVNSHNREHQDERITKLLFERPASDRGKDLRVYVLGNRILASVLRVQSSSDIRANFSLGAKAFLHTLTDEERELAERVIRALPSDLIGVDLIYDNGHPVFNEAEDAVGCRMLYQVSDIDIAKEYITYIAKERLIR